MYGDRAQYLIMPRPTNIHHIVEDFLTSWTSPYTHILPLRHFIENCTQHDLRNFYATDCLSMALLHMNVPIMCQQYLQGQGLSQYSTGLDANQILYSAAYS